MRCGAARRDYRRRVGLCAAIIAESRPRTGQRRRYTDGLRPPALPPDILIALPLSIANEPSRIRMRERPTICHAIDRARSLDARVQHDGGRCGAVHHNHAALDDRRSRGTRCTRHRAARESVCTPCQPMSRDAAMAASGALQQRPRQLTAATAARTLNQLLMTNNAHASRSLFECDCE